MPEKGIIAPDRANWKPVESAEAGEGRALTPEGLIEQVPEAERGALAGLGERVFGNEAVAEVTQVIETQMALLRELGTEIKSPIKWKDIDKRKALIYGAYILIGAVAKELSSPDQAEAAEGENYHSELMSAMSEHLPQDDHGERVALDKFSPSQRLATGAVYGLLQTYEKDGGAPADFEIQVDDIWRVQQEISTNKGYAYEQSRATELSRWIGLVEQQYAAQKDFTAQDKEIVDKAVGAVEEIKGVSPQERLLFKSAVLEAVNQAKDSDVPLRDMIDKLLRVTEATQAQKFVHDESERITLQERYDQILHGEPAADRPAGTVEPAPAPIKPEVKIDVQPTIKAPQGVAPAPGAVEHEFLGMALPEHVELRFSPAYSTSEQETIQNFVDHDIATMQEVARQYHTWQEKYGQKENFADFQKQVENYIKDTVEHVKGIAKDVQMPDSNKVKMVGNIDISPADAALILLEEKSGIVKLRTTEEASEDNFNQIGF